MAENARIKAVDPIEPYKLRVRWTDGVDLVCDIEGLLDKPMFAALRDTAFFESVEIEPEFGDTVVWPNGADLAPEFLHGDYAPPDLPAPERSKA